MGMNVQDAGGARTIGVQENGRKIDIKDDPNNGIELSVTEKVNGQDQTQKYTAKNLQELKQKHPEAEQLYQKYARAAVVPGIQANGQQPAPPMRRKEVVGDIAATRAAPSRAHYSRLPTGRGRCSVVPLHSRSVAQVAKPIDQSRVAERQLKKALQRL